MPTAFLLSVASFLGGFVLRLRCRLIAWFHRNAPFGSAAAKSGRIKRGRRIPFIAPEWRDLEKETEKGLLLVAALLWFATLVFYAIMVGAPVRVGNPQGIGTFHGGVVIVLLISTVVILLRNVRQGDSKAPATDIEERGRTFASFNYTFIEDMSGF